MKGSFHHLDVTVRDLKTSQAFYTPLLEFLGYRCVKADDTVIVWHLEPNDRYVCSLALRPARSDRPHDRYTVGLHHVAWTADSRASVDEFHALMKSSGAKILDAPTDYPEYGAIYYSVFVADPDGMKLEYVYTGG